MRGNLKLALTGIASAVAVALMPMPACASVLYVYDDLGRLASVTYDDGTRVSYNYDRSGNRTSHVVLVSAAPSNNPPAAAPDGISVSNANAYTVTFDPRVNDSDPDSDPLIISGATNGGLGSVSVNTAATALTYTLTAVPPAAGGTATDSFNYTISDGRGGTASAAVTVSISTSGGTANRPPIAIADAISVSDANAYAIVFDPRANDSDPDGDALTISAITNGVLGTVTINPGATTLNYTLTAAPPVPGGTTTDSFSYTIADGRGGTSAATVSVTVSTAPGGGGGGGGGGIVH